MTKGADKKSAPLLCKKGYLFLIYNNINGFIYTLPTVFSAKKKTRAEPLHSQQ